MIPAKYFLDESGNIAKLISVTEIEPYYEDEDEKLYRVTFLYPDGSTSERDMYYSAEGGYRLISVELHDYADVKIDDETICFVDNFASTPQEKAICIEPEHINNLIKSLTLLGNAMELTIASVRNLINAQK